jgi:hypothetical protein
LIILRIVDFDSLVSLQICLYPFLDLWSSQAFARVGVSQLEVGTCAFVRGEDSRVEFII